MPENGRQEREREMKHRERGGGGITGCCWHWLTCNQAVPQGSETWVFLVVWGSIFSFGFNCLTSSSANFNSQSCIFFLRFLRFVEYYTIMYTTAILMLQRENWISLSWRLSVYNVTLIHLIFTESLCAIAQGILKTPTKLIKATTKIASLRCFSPSH